MNDCWYNVYERKVQHSVDASISNKNINTPTVMYNQIEISNQDMCVEKNESIANKDTYVHDVTTVRCISDFDSNEKCDDIIDQGLATVASSCNADYINDDVSNVSRHEVATSRSQTCSSDEVESYVSSHEFDMGDLTCHGEITQDEECESHLS